MISIYSPSLRKPTKHSADWYRSFHDMYYMSQLTNLALQSYLDSFIKMDEAAMIDEFREQFVSDGVIRIDKESQAIAVVKDEELSSVHILDTLQRVIENSIHGSDERNSILLRGMGLISSSPASKTVEIDLKSILGATTTGSWYGLIRRLLNVWEFLFLYGIVETTFRSMLAQEASRTDTLLEQVLLKDMQSGNDSETGKEEFCVLWKFYTALRNVYAHGYGRITAEVKNKLGGKLSNARDALIKIQSSGVILSNPDNFFANDSLEVGKFYFLTDPELNVFRNLAISIMERLDKGSEIEDSIS